jgi:C4-dicarboxylate transporter, DctQ subunit
MKFFTTLGRALDHINIIMVVISAILILSLTFIVGADITLRYLFNKPLGWVKEVSEYILVGLGFLVAAWILKDDAHVKMDLVLNSVSPRTQTMLNIITSGISSVIVLIVTWFSLRVTIAFYQTKLVAPSVLEPPKWILVTPMVIGSFLLALQFIRRTFTFIAAWKGRGVQKSGQ